MKVWQLFLILWVVVFGFWLLGQFRRASKRDDQRLMEQWAKEGGPPQPPVRHPD